MVKRKKEGLMKVETNEYYCVNCGDLLAHEHRLFSQCNRIYHDVLKKGHI